MYNLATARIADSAANMARTLSTGLTVGVLEARAAGLGAGAPAPADAAGAEAVAALAAGAEAAAGLLALGLGADNLTVLAAVGLEGKLIRTVCFFSCGLGVVSSAIMLSGKLFEKRRMCQQVFALEFRRIYQALNSYLAS